MEGQSPRPHPPPAGSSSQKCMTATLQAIKTIKMKLNLYSDSDSGKQFLIESPRTLQLDRKRICFCRDHYPGRPADHFRRQHPEGVNFFEWLYIKRREKKRASESDQCPLSSGRFSTARKGKKVLISWIAASDSDSENELLQKYNQHCFTRSLRLWLMHKIIWETKWILIIL